MVSRTVPALLALAFILAAAPAARAASPAHARLAGCVKGTDPDHRIAMFRGWMSAVEGSVRMQMRFTLQSRTPDQPRYRRVAAPGFSAWLTSASGIRRFVYTKRVEGLLAPASYRAVIRFRWVDAKGRVVRRARRVTRVCREPDPRPDLVVDSLAVQPGPSARRDRYVATVANTGRTAAGEFAVRLSSAGVALATTTVAGLAPGERTRIAVLARACAAGAPVGAEVDPLGAVDERDEQDNTLTIACP